MRRAVFFDRDGVLNRAIVRGGRPYPPRSLGDLELTPDAPEALSRLEAAGFLLIGATNQPDVARGTQCRDVVQAINDAVKRSLGLYEILTCYHDTEDQCECRKPRPGLLRRAARKFQLDLASSFMIGDRWVDIECGTRAGCRTVWIDQRYAETWKGRLPDHRATS